MNIPGLSPGCCCAARWRQVGLPCRGACRRRTGGRDDQAWRGCAATNKAREAWAPSWRPAGEAGFCGHRPAGVVLVAAIAKLWPWRRQAFEAAAMLRPALHGEALRLVPSPRLADARRRWWRSRLWGTPGLGDAERRLMLGESPWARRPPPRQGCFVELKTPPGRSPESRRWTARSRGTPVLPTALAWRRLSRDGGRRLRVAGDGCRGRAPGIAADAAPRSSPDLFLIYVGLLMMRARSSSGMIRVSMKRVRTPVGGPRPPHWSGTGGTQDVSTVQDHASFRKKVRGWAPGRSAAIADPA